MENSFTKRATGNISPCRIVRVDTAVDDGCQQAVLASTTSHTLLGISGEDKLFINYGSLDDGYHATATAGRDMCKIHGEGSRGVLLDIGGTVAAGDRLSPDANGKGITTTTDRDRYAATAEESGVDGDRIRVHVTLGERSTA